MQPPFWLERWAKHEIGFHQAEINPYLQRYWPHTAIPRGATVFVPLCGKSLDMRWLCEQSYRVLGVELARDAIKEFFDEQKLEARVSQEGPLERWQADSYTLLCGDFFALTTRDLQDVSAVFDRASLIALPPDMREQYAAKMKAIVPSAASTLLVALTYPQHEMRGPPHSVPEDEVRRLYADRQIEKLADLDVLDQPENARFKQRGVTKATEQVYLLRPRQ